MALLRTTYLVIAALAVSGAAIPFHELTRDLLSFDAAIVAAYAAFILNAGIGVAGLWTPERAAWVFYLIVSVAGMVLIGEPTPLSAIWLLTKLV